MTMDESNKAKSKTIDKAARATRYPRLDRLVEEYF
jgi:hypothetical protein